MGYKSKNAKLFLAYDETKDDINLKFLTFYIGYIWCLVPFAA